MAMKPAIFDNFPDSI